MNNDRLRAHVPFPERLAIKLKPGLPIELKSPIVQEKIIVKILEISWDYLIVIVQCII